MQKRRLSAGVSAFLKLLFQYATPHTGLQILLRVYVAIM